MALTVALNATPLLSPVTGVARYAAMLAAELVAAGVACRFFYGYRWESALRVSPRAADNALDVWRKLRKPFDMARALERPLQQLCFDRGRPAHDVYHEPNFFPFRSPAPTVTTFHDLSPLRFPETHSRAARRMWERNLPAALERTRLFIAVSSFTKGEMVEVLGMDARKVVVVPNGVSPSCKPLPPEELRRHLTALGLEPGRYALSLGTLEPRKNLVAALDAWRALPEELARSHPLVVAGGQGWLTGPIEERLARLAAAGRARYLGHVPDERLAALYGGARLLVYPSLYEGFGLPPLEAMACGTPVVVSNRASLPEVVGDAGIQVEPEDVAAIAAAARRLIEDAAEHARRSAAGLERAAQFSWRRTAELTIGAYRAALA